MSLRSQIQHAIDDVAPPAPMLERRVKAFVLTDERDRKHLVPRRQPRWVAPLGLIAAALVLALVAGLFIGGRFWRTQNAAPATISQNELKSLDGRPLRYPSVGAGALCPTTPPTLNQGLGMVVGAGPVYLVNGDIYEQGDWGYWVNLGFSYYPATSPGAVLIRARDLKADAQVAFATYPLAPTAISAAGPLLGTADVVNHRVQLRAEAVFPDPWHAKPIDRNGDIPNLYVLFGMQRGSSGCIGLQIDGPNFSENFVINPAIPGL
jgi:hypothetical protein